jgi:hypothetical protein
MIWRWSCVIKFLEDKDIQRESINNSNEADSNNNSIMADIHLGGWHDAEERIESYRERACYLRDAIGVERADKIGKEAQFIYYSLKNKILFY